MKEITLPISGKTATIRRPTGRDVVESERILGAGSGDRAYNLALLSRVTLLDGKNLTYEDFLELDAEDIHALGTTDLGFTESQPKPS